MATSRKRAHLTAELKQQLLADLRADPMTSWPAEVAAAFLGVTDWAMKKWRKSGKGPRFIKTGGNRIAYRKVDLLAWQEANLRQSTSDVGVPVAAGFGEEP